MRVKPICNPSLPSKRWGSPLLRKPIKGEQPLFSIMCRPRSAQALFVLEAKQGGIFTQICTFNPSFLHS